MKILTTQTGITSNHLKNTNLSPMLCEKIIIEAANKTFKIRNSDASKSTPSWWNQEIKQIKKKCIKAQRKITRKHKGIKNPTEDHQNFQELKKELKCPRTR